MKDLQNTIIKGYIGRWSAIDQQTYNGVTYYLMEHTTYGDETCYLVINKGLSFIEETYDDIKTCLKDLGMIS